MAITGTYSRFFFNEGSGLTIADEGNVVGPLSLLGAQGTVWSANADYFTPGTDTKYGNFDPGLDDLFDLTSGGGIALIFNIRIDEFPDTAERIFHWGGSGSTGYIRLTLNSNNRIVAAVRMTGNSSETNVNSGTTKASYLGDDLSVIVTIDTTSDYPSMCIDIVNRTDRKVGGSLSAEAPLKLDGDAWPSIANDSDFGLYFFNDKWNNSTETSADVTGMNQTNAGTATNFRLHDVIIRRYPQIENLYRLRGRIAGEMLSNYVPYKDYLFMGIY